MSSFELVQKGSMLCICSGEVKYEHLGKHSCTYSIINDPFNGHENSKLGRHLVMVTFKTRSMQPLSYHNIVQENRRVKWSGKE